MVSFDEQVLQQYQAAKKDVSVIDRSNTGRIKVTGKDRLDLLNRITTNDTSALQPGTGCTTCLTTDKARIIDWLTVYAFEEHILMLTAPGNQQKVMDWIRRYVIREKFIMEDVTKQTAMLSIFGPKAAKLLQGLTGQDLSTLPMHHHRTLDLAGVKVTIAKTFAIGGDGYNIFWHLSSANMESLWGEVASSGAQPLSEEAFEVLRVEAGLPVYGKELTEEVNPLDALLQTDLFGVPSVSFTKGCYIGQEVIARLYAQEKQRLKLIGIKLDANALPPFHAKLLIDGRDVGWLTSAVRSPSFEKPIALGFVKGERSAGEKVKVAWEGEEATGELVLLPFTH